MGTFTIVKVRGGWNVEIRIWKTCSRRSAGREEQSLACWRAAHPEMKNRASAGIKMSTYEVLFGCRVKTGLNTSSVSWSIIKHYERGRIHCKTLLDSLKNPTLVTKKRTNMKLNIYTNSYVYSSYIYANSYTVTSWSICRSVLHQKTSYVVCAPKLQVEFITLRAVCVIAVSSVALAL